MRFVLRRLGFFAVTLWAAISFNFVIPRLMPGNPVQALEAQHPHLGPQAIHALTVLLGGGGNQSFVAQYLDYWKRVVTFNFGISITTSFGTSVNTMVFHALPWTLGLVGVTTVIAFLLGTFIGLLSGWMRGSWLDSALPPIFVITSAFPYFWVGLLAIYFFSIRLGVLPSEGAYNFLSNSPGFDWHYIIDVLRHAVLPAMTILITSIGGWILTMRNNVITVMADDYIRMARAKGLKPWRIMWKYAGKNAVLPNLTGFAMSVGFVVSGAIVVEYVFNYPGVGTMLLNAVNGLDYPLMQALFLLITVAVLLSVLGADLVTALLDPRTREPGRESPDERARTREPGRESPDERARMSAKARRRPGAKLWRALRHNRKATVGALLLLFFVVLAIFPGDIAPYSPTTITFGQGLAPSSAHWLGTTSQGQDVYSQLIWGTRQSLIIAVAAGGLATLISVVVGVSAAYLGGVSDGILSLVTDVLLVIPIFPLIIVIAAYLRSAGLTDMIIVLGALGWSYGARQLRVQVLSLRNRDFLKAASVRGENRFYIIVAEIMPTLTSLIMATFLGSAVFAVLTAAGLQFVGLGNPNAQSWGTMLYWAQNNEALGAGMPLWAIMPGVCIALLGGAFAFLNYAFDEIANPALRPVRRRARIPFARSAAHALEREGVTKPSANGLAGSRTSTKAPVAGEPPVTHLLEVRHLSVAYATDAGSVVAVDDVDLDLDRGEFLAVVGESGCGKSTLLFAIAQLLNKPAGITGGSVLFRGREMAAMNKRQLRHVRWREYSVVMQNAMNALNPVMTVREQMADACKAHSTMTRQEIADRSAEVLRLVSIDPVHLDSYPHQLSGGMRQRAMIAMALLFTPDLVIMDEPTSALDVVAQRSLMRQIKELQDSLGFAVIFVTHDISLVSHFSDRLMVMYAGQVTELGPTSEIFDMPRHPYARALLEAFPSIRGEKIALTGIAGSPPDMASPPPGCRFQPRCADAMPECASTEPPLYERGGSVVRCLLYKGAAPGTVSLAGRSARRGDGPLGTGEGAPSLLLPPTAPQAAPDQQAPGPVLEVLGLTRHFNMGGFWKRRKLHALDDVSFSIAPKEIVALVGESGSGKSTVARLLAMVYKPTSGDIRFEGKPLAALRGRKESRAYRGYVPMVFQDPYSSINAAYRVSHGILRAVTLHRPDIDRSARRAEALRVMEAVGLRPAETMLSKYPYELSGGQRQRIGFAQALALRPKLILADEPVSMLDVSIRVGILNLMAELRTREGVSILYITHDLASARYVADRVVVMYAGNVVEIGPTEQLMAAPRHPYTKLLLSAAPDPRAPLDGSGAADAGEPPKVVDPAPGCRFQPRCPYAIEVCRTVTPRLGEVAPNQLAACHVALAEAQDLKWSSTPTASAEASASGPLAR